MEEKVTTQTKGCAIIEEIKTQNKKKRKKASLFMLVKNLPVSTRIMILNPDKVYIANFIATLQVTSPVKRTSRLSLLTPNKKRRIKVLISSGEERDKILSNLRNLRDIPTYKTINVTEAKQLPNKEIKYWSDRE